ncbi:MAG: penicillin-insensitive murein endopeptidase, partial [Thermodesulfobacteriota bacterium]
MKLLSLLTAVLLLTCLNAFANEKSNSEAIGAYTAGCIRNSAALDLNGEGFQVIRPSRGRYYGHPETIEFIEYISAKAKNDHGATLLIADISQKTGGPMPDDHSSHQIGLDADILLWQHPIATKHTLTTTQREHIHPQSVLNDTKT